MGLLLCTYKYRTLLSCIFTYLLYLKYLTFFACYSLAVAGVIESDIRLFKVRG